ncbi:MAG: tetratricopeptide repeat protein, partial [Desulfobacterales bacterium]|jgi:adenylate cyclase
MRIITALQIKLSDGETARIYARGTTNLEAYLKGWQAARYRRKGTKEDNARARQLFEEAIALDPNYSGLYAGLGWAHAVDARNGWSKSRKESMEKALKLAQKALALDDSRINGGWLLAYIYRQKRQYEKSIDEAKRLIDLTPGEAIGYKMLAAMLYPLGRGEETVAAAKKAIRRDPMTSASTFYWLGMGHWVMDQYEEALEAYKKALNISPTGVYLHTVLTVTYSLLDREEEARAAAAELLRLDPDFSVDRIAKRLPFKDKAYTERYVNALRKAGLK